MKIAYTMGQGRGDTDLLFFQLAKTLISQGLKPAGITQINSARADTGPCNMDVKVLPTGPCIRISQNLGTNAKGCRLDPEALERAVGLVDATLSKNVSCLIINKFGKHEADGRGFRNTIAQALHAGIPVLVGLNELNHDAFQEFCGEMAVQLSFESEVLENWVMANINHEEEFA